MIKKIVIRDVASYDHDGCTFDDLAKVNIIFGGNGTGKTTLSRLLEQPSDFPTCKVEWDGKPVEVFVYNQDFKRRCLKEKMPGIFTISEDIISLARKRSTSVWRINRKLKVLSKRGEEPDTIAEEEQLSKQKDELLDNFLSLKPAIDNINRLLILIGFKGYSLQQSPEDALSYQIKRSDGSLASDTLSEGEITLITFLYFMQQVYGGGKDLENVTAKVVVIDDPISSLDSDVMFVVGELIQQILDTVRGRKTPRFMLPSWSISFDNTGNLDFGLAMPIKGVQQAFVLTHNVYFYKQITERQRHADTHYWKLIKNEAISKCKGYGVDNPIRSEYELLWAEVRKVNNDEENSVSIQNVMRRIIETYFVVMGGYNKRKLIPENFSDDPEEMIIVNSLAKWADVGSHRTVEDLYAGNSQEMKMKYLKVFNRLFVKLGHEAHYKMMMREE